MALTKEAITRWYRKADALYSAWVRRYGVAPSKSAVILALCPPSAETKCGDSWPGPDGTLGTQDDENNWGATTFRSLNAAEQAAVKAAGVLPTVGTGHQERAKQAMAAIAAAGLPVASGSLRGVTVPRSVIHCDSRTEKRSDGTKVQVPYFVHFAAFDSETGGAEYYLTFVAEPGFASRAVLDNPNAGVSNLAAAMYTRGYFFGFSPHSVYTHAGADKVLGTADDETRDGNAENVAAYAKWLAPHFATITAALTDWKPLQAPDVVSTPPAPTEPAPAPPFVLSAGPQEIFRALGVLGFVRPMGKPYHATRYLASLGFYQGAMTKVGHEDDIDATLDDFLSVDGDPGPDTIAALKRDLRVRGFQVA